MSRPTIKELNTVLTDAKFTAASNVLRVILDIDSNEYLMNRIIEAIRVAQNDTLDKQPEKAAIQLKLAMQLAAIARAKIIKDSPIPAIPPAVGQAEKVNGPEANSATREVGSSDSTGHNPGTQNP
jgi:hypothetical protein